MNHDRLARLFDSWREARAAGRSVSVAELCADEPELLAPLREHIARSSRDGGPADAPTGDYSGASTADRVAAPALSSLDAEIEGFRIQGILGEGGFGRVYRARDRRLGRSVALKVLRDEALERPGARESFLREARALAAVQHDHVVPIYQIGEAGDRPYLAMPLLAGETLASRIEREGALPPAEVCRIGREAALGLAALHAKGLVHRDLKPGNIWLEAGTGRARVLDLGLARDPFDGAPETAIAGTPAYMSPEQATGRELDARSDLFSLGSLLYEAATGRRAFAGKTTADTLRSVAEQTPPSVFRLNPGVPAGLAGLIDRLQQKDLAARPASAAAVADELARIGDSLRPGGASARGRAGRRVLAAVAVAAVLVVGAVAVFGRSGDRLPDPPAAAPPVAPVVEEPLRVRSLRVQHFERVNDRQVRARGPLGSESFAATTADFFEADAELSRPAYCYLITFRGDGRDAVLFPQDDTDAPEKTARPVYPSRRRDKRYGLNDGPGVWLVALVASDDPLPDYRAWRSQHPGGPWQHFPAEDRVVWLDDGQILESLTAGRPATRGPRGEADAPDKGPVVRLVDWLKRETNGTVAAVAFPVADAR